MDEIDNLIRQILLTLKAELPAKYTVHIDEFESLTSQDLLRASFDILDNLRRKQDWNPSTKLQGLIERYKIVF